MTRAVAERLTPSTRRLATCSNSRRVQRSPLYAVPVFVLTVPLQTVHRYRCRRPAFVANEPWPTMLRPCFPRLSHPGVAHAAPSTGFMAKVYRGAWKLTDQQRAEQAPFAERRPQTSLDIGALSLDGGHAVNWLLYSEADEAHAHISPDGRWITYESDESGQRDIYVQPFPNVADGRWQISTDGGTTPMWAADGRELFYRRLDDAAMMVVQIETEPTFSHRNPSVLFHAREFLVTGPSDTPAFDISADGQRFLMIRQDAAAEQQTIVVVQNWFEELERLVPRE